MTSAKLTDSTIALTVSVNLTDCTTALTISNKLTLSSLNLPLSSSSLQAANCCRNSRLLADEDDLKWVANEKKYR